MWFLWFCFYSKFLLDPLKINKRVLTDTWISSQVTVVRGHKEEDVAIVIKTKVAFLLHFIFENTVTTFIKQFFELNLIFYISSNRWGLKRIFDELNTKVIIIAVYFIARVLIHSLKLFAIVCGAVVCIMFVNMATGGAASYSSCSASVLGPQDNGVQSADNVS